MAELYLLCFDRPYKHARHYLGFSYTTARRRLRRHVSGAGANLLKHVLQAGINFRIIRTWQGEPEELLALERKIKRNHDQRKYCPKCNRRKRAMNSRQNDILDLLKCGYTIVSYKIKASGRLGQRWAIMATFRRPSYVPMNYTLVTVRKIGSFDGFEEMALILERDLNRGLPEVKNVGCRNCGTRIDVQSDDPEDEFCSEDCNAEYYQGSESDGPIEGLIDGALLEIYYFDEYPELKGEEWEVAMDSKGHNVTSHLSQDGPCGVCVHLGSQIKGALLEALASGKLDAEGARIATGSPKAQINWAGHALIREGKAIAIGKYLELAPGK